MTAFYNEIDPYAAEWLRNLIAAGHIAPGVVDTRSILDIEPHELRGYTQCHFFAGIGVWSRALRLAQWPDTRPVWTGSCPCQPFSVAGQSAGMHDERHLWPYWHWLIQQCSPPVVFGEQVEAAVRHGWLDLVSSDLEGIGYRVGATALPAGGVGAPHIRQRLWFVADTVRGGRPEGRSGPGSGQAAWAGRAGGLDHHHHQGLEGHGCAETPERDSGGSWASAGPVGAAGADGGLADADHEHNNRPGSERARRGFESADCGNADSEPPTRPANSFWGAADWLLCRDGKWRPVEPGTFPLAHGAAARVGRLRAYGNAIVPQAAAEVIAAYMDVTA